MTQSDIPATLTAGDTWTWSNFDAYQSHNPSDSWSVQYVLRPVSGGTSLTVEGTPDVNAFAFRVAPADTAALPPGDFRWSVLAFGPGGSRETIGHGRLTVNPDPTQTAGDLRSQAERILDAIESTIEGRVTKDADSYTIEGRSIARTPISDLMRLQGVYQRRVAQERNPGASPITYRRAKF
ncbi:MAG: hypothetical protein AAGL96_14545 [Pseudomonadota bacterium]